MSDSGSVASAAAPVGQSPSQPAVKQEASASSTAAVSNGPMETEFSRIILQTKGQKRTGHLSLSPAGLKWVENRQNGKVVDVGADDMTEISWSSAQSGKEHQLTVRMEGAGESSVKFQGFRSAALGSIKRYAASHKISFREIERATTGWNWGEVEFDDANMIFKVGGKLGFELPLSTINQSVIQGKNEISIEMHQDDLQDDEQALVEMRLWVPPSEDDPDNQDLLKEFNDTIIQKADIGVTREHYAEFEKLMFLTPRGRYNIRLFNNFFTLQGQTFQYKILYKNITKMFLFTMPDNVHTEFIVSLNPPIRQGRTSYPFLIMNFKTADEVSTELNIPDKVLEEKYADSLKKVMEGSMHHVVSLVFKALTGKKILVPGSFRSERTQSSAVRCSYKANLGELFVLEKSFFFVHKPPLYIRHDEIYTVEFASHGVGGGDKNLGGRSFDLKLTLRDSNEEISFTSIDSGEFGALFGFITDKELNVLNIKETKRRLGSVTTGSGRASRPKIEGGFLAQLASDSEMGDDSEDEGDSDFEAGSDSEVSGGSGGSGSDSELESEVDEDGMPSSKSSTSRSSSVKKEKKEKKKEKPKVKKANSAYLYFTKEVRPKLAEDNPDKSFGMIGQMLGQQWKELSEEERGPYNALAEQDKQRYADEIAALPEDQRPQKAVRKSAAGAAGGAAAKGKKKGSSRQPGQPKRPTSSYFLYVNANRQALRGKHPELKPVEITRQLALDWKALSDEDKEPYNEQARRGKEQYEEAMLKWKREQAAAGTDGRDSGMEDEEDAEMDESASDQDADKKRKKKDKKDKKKKKKKEKKEKKKSKKKSKRGASEDEDEDEDADGSPVEEVEEEVQDSGDDFVDTSNIISGSRRRKRTPSAEQVAYDDDEDDDDDEEEEDDGDEDEQPSKRLKMEK